MEHEHLYNLTVTWTGNRGSGTSDYRAYSRDHEIHCEGKAVRLPGSSDAAFRGDPARYSPEELLVASLSSCHMLWFLHLCADAGIVVISYRDSATGMMSEHPDGSGEFTRVTLQPYAIITDASRITDTVELHRKAHEL